MLKRTDVLTCNSGHYRGDFQTRYTLGLFNGALNRLNRLGNIIHHAAMYSKAFCLTHAKDFNFAVLIETPNDRNNFGCSNV